MPYPGSTCFFLMSCSRLRTGLVTDKTLWRVFFEDCLLMRWTVVTIGLRDTPVRSFAWMSPSASSSGSSFTALSSLVMVPSEMSVGLRDGRQEMPGYWAASASLRAVHMHLRREDPYVC